jgi:hypothetical protein
LGGRTTERERILAIAYIALSLLCDLDPTAEPVDFKQTRIHLAHLLDDAPGPPQSGPAGPHLRLL